MPESILCALVNLTLSEGDKPLKTVHVDVHSATSRLDKIR